MSFRPSQVTNLVTRQSALPRSQTLKFNSGATVLAPQERTPNARVPLQGPSTCPRCAGPDAHSLCRCRSRRGGDREAPPWGRSRWSGRKSLGRRAPAAASEPHTWLQRGSASSLAKEGAPGGRKAVSAAAERELLALGLVLPPLPQAIACPLQAAPRGWLPASWMPIGFFSSELAPAPLGCGFPPHPCVGFVCINSLSYRNQATLTCFRCTPTLSSLSLLYS